VRQPPCGETQVAVRRPGAGAVGQARAFALMLRGAAREIVLVDKSVERATGVATDMRYAVPLAPTAGAAGLSGCQPGLRRRASRSRPRLEPAAPVQHRGLPRDPPESGWVLARAQSAAR
jgi:lactate/malate dehydrogenase, NAD binding domain